MGVTRAEPLLVYDGDCAFCTTTAHRLAARWRRPATIVAYQQLTGDELAQLGLTLVDVQQAAWWVDDEGITWGGHEAVSRALVACGGWRGLAGKVIGLRALRRPAAVAYRTVAEHRHRLPGATDACRLDLGSERLGR